MSSMLSTRFALLLLSAPLLLAARCENAYESMGSDGGSAPEPEPQAGRATGGSAGKNGGSTAGKASFAGSSTGGTRAVPEPDPEAGSGGTEPAEGGAPSGGTAPTAGTGGTGGAPTINCDAFDDAE